jgi:hypothetical protein
VAITTTAPINVAGSSGSTPYKMDRTRVAAHKLRSVRTDAERQRHGYDSRDNRCRRTRTNCEADVPQAGDSGLRVVQKPGKQYTNSDAMMVATAIRIVFLVVEGFMSVSLASGED